MPAAEEEECVRRRTPGRKEGLEVDCLALLMYRPVNEMNNKRAP
jgi:hypothetical protein